MAVQIMLTGPSHFSCMCGCQLSRDESEPRGRLTSKRTTADDFARGDLGLQVSEGLS